MDNDIFTTTRRPYFEGQNVMTWLGFKHVMYLAEEAVIDYLRKEGILVGKLFRETGLAFEITHSSGRLLHAIQIDDTVTIKLSEHRSGLHQKQLMVEMFVPRDGQILRSYKGKVQFGFKKDHSLGFQSEAEVAPLALEPFTSKDLNPYEAGDSLVVEMSGDALSSVRKKYPNAYVWQQRIPYYYCHYNERLQMSGYLRYIEEAQDRFLADKGISIYSMLRNNRWIPVVPSASLTMHQESYMEEDLLIVYQLSDIIKNFTYTHDVLFYRQRDSRLDLVASGKINHGYARLQSRDTMTLAPMDSQTIDKLGGFY